MYWIVGGVLGLIGFVVLGALCGKPREMQFPYDGFTKDKEPISW